MSKTSELAARLGLPVTVNDKTIYVEMEEFKERFEIKTNITKNMCKAEIWQDGHFIGRCMDKDENVFADKLIQFLRSKAESLDIKRELKQVNWDLCDYLTTKLEENGFSIINKASNEIYGSYVVQKRHQYQIKASYQESQVNISRVTNNRDNLETTKIEMANPELEKQICEVLLELENQP